MITIITFNKEIFIFAYQLQNFRVEKNINFKLVSINVRQTIKSITLIHSRFAKLKRDTSNFIERIKSIEFIESKHVFRWVVNHSRFRRNVRAFVHIVKIVLKDFVSFIIVSLSQNFTTKTFISIFFSIETKTKTFIRWFNNTSKIIVKKIFTINFLNFNFRFIMTKTI